MSFSSPYYDRAQEEAEFLRHRLDKLQDKMSGGLDPELHADFLHTLYALIDKEHSMLTRLQLINTAESRREIEKLDAYKVVGLINSDDVTIGNVYPTVKKELISLIKNTTGEDFDPEDFDVDIDDPFW